MFHSNLLPTNDPTRYSGAPKKMKKATFYFFVNSSQALSRDSEVKVTVAIANVRRRRFLFQ
jgi:hypothetical protein